MNDHDMIDIPFHQIDLSSESQRLNDIRDDLIRRKYGRKQAWVAPSLRRALLASAAAVFLMLVVVFTVPPIRTLAEELLRDLFPRTAPHIMIEYTDEDVIFVDSFSELQQRVNFTIRPFSISAAKLRLFEYNPVRNTASQHLETSGRWMRFTQQSITDAESKGLLSFTFDMQIPPQAVVQRVRVGEYEGDLVRGMWVTGTPDAPNPVYRWDEGFYFYSLRWQDEVFVYEVQLMPLNISERSKGESSEKLERETILLANRLMRE